MKDKPRRFAVCVRNEEHEESLDLRKIYEVLDDSPAAEHNMIRVIDEEGEDYLYPADWFAEVQMSPKAKRRVAAALK